MSELLIKALENSLKSLGIENPQVHIEHPEDHDHGDFSTNVALVYAKNLSISPKELAVRIVEEVRKEMPQNISSLEIAGPGFINIKLSSEYFSHSVVETYKNISSYGTSKLDSGKQIMVEYTDPNPFKIFHIGHLMANTLGESISRLIEVSGAEVIRVCYQGDTGMHVARTIWAALKHKDIFPDQTVEIVERIGFLGNMYVYGSQKYDTDEIAKKEIIDINKKIFEKSDGEITALYEKGRVWSLEYFDLIYDKLGTKFNRFFFESDVASDGVAIVKEFLTKGVFEESEGAVIFPGEKYGEHTRVFMNSQGLPTYEAKELGLTKQKFELYPKLSESIVITANEQNDYFKVVIAALNVIYPDMASKMKHISHGILRPESGKMSSRKGNIVSAETLLNEFESLVDTKIHDRDFDEKTRKEVREKVAIAGLKYSILRQAIGGDIIYDSEKSVSFEGDSGPYLQYACVRARAVVTKAHASGVSLTITELPKDVSVLERIIVRFPEVVARARREYAPHYVVTYLIELASSFNSFYSLHTIIDHKDPVSAYRIALTNVFTKTMEKGLWILGIQTPDRM